MFEGHVEPTKRLSLLYDDVESHHMITKLTGASSKLCVFKACNKECTPDVTHVCDQTCCECMANSQCAVSDVRIPCDEYNRPCGSRKYYDNHKQGTSIKNAYMNVNDVFQIVEGS